MEATHNIAALRGKHHLGRFLPGLLGLAALGLAVPAAQAQTAYVDSFNSANGPGADTFGTLNLQTGAFTAINSNLSSGLFALGFGSDGTLYGLGQDNSTGTELYQVATDTGIETSLKDFADTPVFGGSGGADGNFTAITITAASTSLFTINPVTETLTAGIATSGSPDGLVVADGSGKVYVSSTTFGANGQQTTDTLDVLNTAATSPMTNLVGDTGLNNLFTGLYTGGQLYTFGTDPNGTGNEGIYTLSTATGAATLVAATSNNENIYAAAVSPAAVPEASTTLSFGLLLALGGLVIAKRKKAAASA